MSGLVSNDGGYDANFVEDVSDFLQCVICQLALRKPVHVIDCGHRFCKCCFEKMKQFSTARLSNLLCPLDKQVIIPSKVFPDKGIERLVLDLKVKCNNEEKSCKWIGELRSLKDHVGVDCYFEIVTCKHDGCNVKMKHQKLKEHTKRCLKDENVSNQLWDMVNTLTHRVNSLKEDMKNKNKKIERCNEQIQEKEKLLQKCSQALKETKNELKQVKEKVKVFSKDLTDCLSSAKEHKNVLTKNSYNITKLTDNLKVTETEVEELQEEKLSVTAAMIEFKELRGENILICQKHDQLMHKYKCELAAYDDKLKSFMKDQLRRYTKIISSSKFDLGYVEMKFRDKLNWFMEDQSKENEDIVAHNKLELKELRDNLYLFVRLHVNQIKEKTDNDLKQIKEKTDYDLKQIKEKTDYDLICLVGQQSKQKEEMKTISSNLFFFRRMIIGIFLLPFYFLVIYLKILMIKNQ